MSLTIIYFEALANSLQILLIKCKSCKGLCQTEPTRKSNDQYLLDSEISLNVLVYVNTSAGIPGLHLPGKAA